METAQPDAVGVCFSFPHLAAVPGARVLLRPVSAPFFGAAPCRSASRV